MATLTEKGQVVIPARIRRKYGLIPGTKIDFVDNDGCIRLRITRPVPASTVDEGFGMIRCTDTGRPRRLSEFDPAAMVARKQR
ncbi:MAG: AbrB/MazE/SpoVT family DNA-binding domain-containing protein [Gammaproteobacteria bacterium]|nr:AbrB/MazE/SpoVT family DNA-binding domain-containing protein [Gammaproteobacteria bacterium]